MTEYFGIVDKGSGSGDKGLEDNIVYQKHYQKSQSQLYSVLSVLGEDEHCQRKEYPDDTLFTEIGKEEHYVIKYAAADVFSQELKDAFVCRLNKLKHLNTYFRLFSLLNISQRRRIVKVKNK